MKGPDWSALTAIFGGAFDPPHLGHREALKGLFLNPGVRDVVVLPAANPPGKITRCSIDHRLAMVRLAFGPAVSYPKAIEIDLREIDRARTYPLLPGYTFDTLQDFTRTGRQVAFVVGADQVAQLHRWHRFPEILGLCHWIVLDRKPDGADKINPALTTWDASGLIRKVGNSGLWQVRNTPGNQARWIQVVPTDAAHVSSTHIREAIAKTGHPPDGSLYPPVEAYLKQNRLYGMSSGS